MTWPTCTSDTHTSPFFQGPKVESLSCSGRTARMTGTVPLQNPPKAGCATAMPSCRSMTPISMSHAPRLQTEKSFFILNLESVQLCPSPVLPHAISAQNCAEFEVKHKSKSSWTHSNPGTWKLVLILKWKTDGLAREDSLASDSTKIWNGLYCITWNTILRIPDPESKTISRDSGVGRNALRRYPEKSFFILEMEIVQLCPSPVLPHEISAQNCAGFEAKQKSRSSWTHSNPGTWKRLLISEMENRRASPDPRLGEGLN